MGSLKRRDFLSHTGLGAFGLLGSGITQAVPERSGNGQVLKLSQCEKKLQSKEFTVNVKPVGCYMIHRGVWTGPCRWNPNPPPEQEKLNFTEWFGEFVQSLKKDLSPQATILEPLYMEYPEATGFAAEQLDQLKGDRDQVDLYLITGNTYPQYPGCLIGEMFLKPVAMIGGYVNWEMSARLRSKDLEGYSPADMGELNELISIIRARKSFQNTRILIVSDDPFNNRPAPSACMDLDELKARFGIEAVTANYMEMAKERENVQNSPQSMKEINTLADRLIANAQNVRITREWMIPNLVFHIAVKNLLARHGCNAFTMECFEFCSSRLACDWKAVPCLVHSLLKDEGLISGCEGDMNALLAMDLLMSLSRRPAFMGNLYLKDTNTFYLGHNVPALKMLGYDKPDLPYSLQNFITEGWGPKMQMDLAGFEEKTVTIARCNPTARRVLLTRGAVIGCEGQDAVGCSLKAVVSIPDVQGLIHKAHDYGFHFAMVYGDYTAGVAELARMLKMKVEPHAI